MHRYSLVRLCAVATAVLAVACSEQSTPAASSGVVEVDSAGVSIVESPARADLPRWSVDATPTTIGVVEGPAEYTLHRVGAGRVLPDGRIVIANSRTELRFYDRDGVHLRTVGRRGEGPGEFRDIAGLVLAPDTLFVYDGSNQRLTFLSPAGDVLGSAPSGAAGTWVGSRVLLAAVTDAGLVFLASGFSVPRRDSVGLFRVRMPNVVAARDGEGVDTLGVTAMEWLTGNQHFIVPPFARTSFATADAQHVVTTDPDRYQLEVWDVASRRLTRMLRLEEMPPPLRAAAFDSAARETVDREVRAQLGDRADADHRAGLEEIARHLQPYATLPGYSDVLVDDGGRIWARRWAYPGAASHEFDVFAPEGQRVAMASVPRSVALLHVGRDFILTREVDDLGVEYVRLYDLVRGE